MQMECICKLAVMVYEASTGQGNGIVHKTYNMDELNFFINVGGTRSSTKAISRPNLKSLALCMSIETFHILATSPLLVKKLFRE